MVFRGKPSKACLRCRKRKLRCDLEIPSCTSCMRASAKCSGYRDTESLRFTDETQATCIRATTQKATVHPRTSGTSLRPTGLPLDLLVQAREFFLGYYVGDFCKVWDFLCPYFRSSSGPEHLTLSIDAISLAFLAHQVSSQTAQQLSRRKYVAALRKTNAALQNPDSAYETTMLQTSLLLDLFEKMTSTMNEGQDPRRAHVDGALALVKLRGLEHFNDDAGLKVLSRLLLSATITYFSQGDPVAQDIYDIRNYLAQFSDTSDPKWKLSALVLKVTDLVSEMVRGRLNPKERVKKCIDLDDQLEVLYQEAPSVWFYERRFLSEEDIPTRAVGNFYDVHKNRITTQRWNALHSSRLILSKEIMQSLSRTEDAESRLQLQRAFTAASHSIELICASVAQMTDCNGPAQKKVTDTSILDGCASHTHTLCHLLDVYILIFPLYAAWWSCACTPITREWIFKELQHISEHFGIKEAKIVLEMMHNASDTGRIDPWKVYRLLGSYSFAA